MPIPAGVPTVRAASPTARRPSQDPTIELHRGGGEPEKQATLAGRGVDICHTSINHSRIAASSCSSADMTGVVLCISAGIDGAACSDFGCGASYNNTL